MESNQSPPQTNWLEVRSGSGRRQEQNEANIMDIDTLARTMALQATIPQMNTFNAMAPWPPLISSNIPLSASESTAAAAVPLSFKENSFASSPPIVDSATYSDQNTASSVHGLNQEPHENDVLCGRGGSINSHPGNRKFRDWVYQRKESYMLAKSKSDKTHVTADILYLVRNQTPPGRFLQKFTVDQDGGRRRSKSSGSTGHLDGWWVEIDETKALAKCSQALREGAPAFRALNKTEKKVRKKKNPTSSEGSSLSATRNKLLQQQIQHAKKKKDLPKQPPSTSLVTSVDVQKEPTIMLVGMPPAVKTQQESHAASSFPIPFPPPYAFPLTSDIDKTNRELNVLYPVSSSIFETESDENVRSISSFPLLHLGDYTASIADVARAIPTPTATESKPVISPSGEWIPGSLLCSPFTPFVSPGLTPHIKGTRTAGGGWLDAISFLPNLSPMPPGHGDIKEGQNLKRSHSLSSFSEGDFYSDDSFKNPFENDNGNIDLKQEPLHKFATMPQDQSSDSNHGMMCAETQSQTFLPMPPHGYSTERFGLYDGNNTFYRHSSGHKSTSRASSISSLSQRSISNIHNHSKRKSIS